ncbi:phage terminase large subunit family protein [Paenibacillus larvae]|nr:phage terminase large subunit family protein [Paenibacillus larvae]
MSTTKKKKTIRVEHACRKCGALHGEQEWKAGQKKPGSGLPRKKHSTTRGFHLNELASTFPVGKLSIIKRLKSL